jgi:hypothetical protein
VTNFVHAILVTHACASIEYQQRSQVASASPHLRTCRGRWGRPQASSSLGKLSTFLSHHLQVDFWKNS